MTPVILTVDRSIRNLEILGQFLAKEGYQPQPVSTLEAFDLALEDTDKLGLALVDISGFDRGIWHYCQQLSDHGVPLLVIAPQKLSQIQQESLAHGAQAVLYKPLVVKDLTLLIQRMIRNVA